MGCFAARKAIQVRSNNYFKNVGGGKSKKTTTNLIKNTRVYPKMFYKIYYSGIKIIISFIS